MKRKMVSALLCATMVAGMVVVPAATAQAADKKVIGVTMPTKDLQRWNQDGENMKKELEAAGYEVDLQYASNDVSTQVSQLENQVANGCDLLVVASIDGSSLGEPLKQAKEKGIPVANVPTYGTQIVGQYAVGLLMEICSHYGHHAQTVAEGKWENNADWCYWHYPMIEVSGKTAGIIGLGRIGVNTAKILKAMNVNVIAYDAFQSEAGKQVATYVELDELLAKSDFIFLHCPLIELYGKTAGIIGLGRIGQATAKILNSMDMKVIAYDAYESEAGKKLAEYVDLDTLFAQSDVIFLHCPLFPETEGIINKENIAKMKDGVILINNSRGQLVVEQDLADALNSGKVYAAGLDVVSTEPIKGDNPLLKAKNCFITPHISWAAQASRQRIMDITADNLKAFVEGNPVNIVNK